MNQLHRIVFVFWVVLISASGGCTRLPVSAADPKARLREYISKTFSVSRLEEREVLQGYLTGEAKARLQSWSDDQFAEAFIDSKRKLQKITIREVKNVSPTETNITYELAYSEDYPRKTSSHIVNKKMCTLVLEDGEWRIRSAKNIKVLVEYDNEMSLP